MIFLIVIFVTLGLGSADGYKDGLYSTDTDDVLPLDKDSFQNQVIKSKPGVVWVVEFYNSWCGHCIHFAPTWKTLATDLKGWRDIIVIAAIDCSQKTNLETCRTFEITGYPTVKMFPPLNSPARLENVLPIDSLEIKDIKEKIINFMSDHPSDSWPSLQPLEKIEDIWEDNEDKHKHVILIFEEEESLVGQKVILDLRHTPNVLVRRMLKDKVMKFGINKFPSLYKVNPDSTYKVLATGKKMAEADRTLFVETVKLLARGEEDKIDTSMNDWKNSPGGDSDHRQVNSNKAVKSTKKNESSAVNMQDLESALHYTFRQEIAICKTIEGDKLKALKTFVEVLMKYFPGRKPIQGFLSKVFSMLSEMKSQSISGEEWMDKIDRIQDKDNFLPEVIKWESCQGSSPRFRGYPCSMWTLFHVLTVSAYRQHSGARPSNPQEVLLAIRGYMDKFFGCQECSKNFLLMAKSVPEEVKQQRDSVLWLWSAHNKANKRLHNDISEDPSHPKVQFPLSKMCGPCHKMTKSKDGTMILSWDVDKVLEFLLNFYSEKNITVPSDLQKVFQENSIPESEEKMKMNENGELDWWEKKQREQDLKKVRWLRQKKQEKIRGAQEGLSKRNVNGEANFDDSLYSNAVPVKNYFPSMWGLTHLDISMCVMFYLISTFIILILYHHFIVRRRIFPCKNIKNGSWS